MMMPRRSLPIILAGSLIVPGTARLARAFEDPPSGQATGRVAAAENYDIRDDRSKEARSVFEQHRRTVGAARLGRCEHAVRLMKEEKQRLEREGVAVQLCEESGAAEIVGAKAAGRLAPAGTSREAALRSFLLQNHQAYGLTTREIPYLKKTADYVNPAGNLAWVELKQEVSGIPVFGGQLRAAFTRQGEMVRTTGTLAPALDDYDDDDAALVPEGPPNVAAATTPTVSAAEAVSIAAASIGVKVGAGALRAKASAAGGSVLFEPGPFDEDIRVEPQYFPLEPGVLALAWSMVLWQDEPAYYTLVDAETGQVLFRKNITDEQAVPATYRIYNDDSPAPLSPSNVLPGDGTQAPGIERTTLTLVSELPAFDDLGWINDDANVTTGNNVDAGLDIVAPNGIDPDGRAIGSPFRVFDFPYNPSPLGTDVPTDPNYRSGIVTNLFFWSNRYHDRLYELGFTEAAGNFQLNNFGRGGLGNDFVRAEAQDRSGTNNANFSTPPDGSLPRMQMFIWTGPDPDRDGDIDHDIVLHELTHGTSNRLHSNAAGLGTTQSGGMGEGWSDFYGRALLSDASEDVHGVYAMAGYSTFQIRAGFTDNYYYGIRRFPYAVKSSVGANGKPFNPMTFADIDASKIDLTDGAFPRGPIGSATAHEVHNLGEIWAMMLFEVRARIIDRMGWATGNQRTLQIVTDGMKLDPRNPTFLNARDSIIAADCAGFGGSDEDDIWAGFAARGMGFGAKSTAAAVVPITVTESFDLPNLVLGPTTLDDATCNANGIAEPGEDVTLHVPIRNPFCGKAVTGVTASLDGGPKADIGDLGAGGNATADLRFTVPADAACGSTLILTVNLDSNLGPVTRTFTLEVGRAVDTSLETFDAAATPALPDGWTTAASGAQAPWTTQSTTVDTPPNAAFSANATTPGVNELVSPELAVTAANARVTFRNNFNMEPGFDGGVLEISIAGGDFTDILAAGGSFASGGYTGTLAASANPLGGRAAWTGNSGGFITTVVNLPASAAGQPVRLRFQCGTDNGTGGPGWFIDEFAFHDGFSCGDPNCRADLALTKVASPDPVLTGGDLTYTLNVTNNGPARAAEVSLADATPVGTTFQSVTTPFGWTCTTPAPGGTGAVDCANASVENGESATLSLVVNVDCGLANGTTISNAAQLSSARPDPEATNNAAASTVVASNPPPAIGAMAPSPSVLWPPNHQLVDVTVDYATTDNCGVVACTLRVTSNEAERIQGSDNTAPDFVVIDAHHVRLRAERAGFGSGRIYTITATCSDSAGTQTTRTTTVRVPHDQR